MKSIYKIALPAMALFTAVALGACATENAPHVPEDPDEKSFIDNAFLTRLARGEESAEYSLEDVNVLVKSYDPANGIDSDWWDPVMSGWQSPDHSNIMILNGRAWRLLILENLSTGSKSILYHPWRYFCDVADMTKDVRVGCSFEIDITNKKFLIDGINYDIEKAESDTLVLADINTTLVPDSATREKVPGLMKFVLTYTLLMKDINPDEYLYFESDKDAKLGLVRMMRQYFGDHLDLTQYADTIRYNDRILENPVIDLAALEDDITNDRDEWYSWKKTTYHDRLE